MKRLIIQEIQEYTLEIKIIQKTVSASSNNAISNFNDFVSECKRMLKEEYKFQLLQDEQSNKSCSRYLRFRAANSKGGIIVIDIYFELRLSDHPSTRNRLLEEYDNEEDNQKQDDILDKINEYDEHHKNFINMKINEFHAKQGIKLSDIIIDSENYDEGIKQFKKRLGVAMKKLK